MKENNEIDAIVKRVIEESLQEKADDLVGKIKTKMDEWNPNEPVNISGQPSDMHEEGEPDTPNPDDRINKFCDPKSPDYDEEACKYHKREFGEQLKGGQKKLDLNKNKKLDSDDFRRLRAKKGKMGEDCADCEKSGSDKKNPMMRNEVDFKFSDEVNEGKEKWIQDTGMKKGALHRRLGVPEGEKIPVSKLRTLKTELEKKSEGDKKLSASDSKLLKQINLALTLRKVRESKEKVLRLTEAEMLDLIERIIKEQSKPRGKAETDRVLGLNKGINDEQMKNVADKMKKYLKDASKGTYNPNPDKFPKGNGELAKMEKKAYQPSEMVDEYIEAFAYPGQTNLVYDEIKPDDDTIKKQLEGDPTTGNSQDAGNAVKSDVGKRFYKNYKDNLYGAEQMTASYKRYPQPVDIAGDKKPQKGSLKKAKGPQDSHEKAHEVMSKVESVKSKDVVTEDVNKMKQLISYREKTQ